MIGLLVLFSFAACLIVAIGTLVSIYGLRHPPRGGMGVAMARRQPIEPADLGLAASDILFKLPDGYTSPGWIITGKAPAAPAVVVTHGWGDNRIGTLPLAALLAPFTSAIVIYDVRAHGESTAPKCDLGTTEVDDLLYILDQVDPALEKIVLYGHSIGGGISIAAAAKAGAQSRIRGVIVEGAYRHGMEPIYGFYRLNRWPTFPFLILVSLHLSFWICRAWKFDRARHAAKLACPLLLLHGTADPVSPIHSAREVAAAAPDSTFIAFEGGGHLDLARSDPTRYLEAVANFLDRVKQSPPETTAPTSDPAP